MPGTRTSLPGWSTIIPQAHDVRRLDLAAPRLALRFETLAAGARRCPREEEEFLKMSPDGIELFERFLLVHVHEEQVEGLPAAAPARLVEAVRTIAGDKDTRQLTIAARADAPPPGVVIDDTALEAVDILTDGEGHREHCARRTSAS